MPKIQSIFTEQAPKPIGPYSQAVRAGDFLFCSGQIALDPATGGLSPGDVQAQAKRAMDNLQAVLTAAGADFTKVVKTTIFLKSMGDFPKVNEVYGSYFGGQAVAPARSTVEAARLPKDVLVEVEAIAYLGS